MYCVISNTVKAGARGGVFGVGGCLLLTKLSVCVDAGVGVVSVCTWVGVGVCVGVCGDAVVGVHRALNCLLILAVLSVFALLPVADGVPSCVRTFALCVLVDCACADSNASCR
jgi:hypothetical protein